MRVIKFRGWDKTGNRMIANPLITEINSAAEYIGINDGFSKLVYYNVVLQQYVGMVDKNGKEIYEGDIVKAKAIDQNGEVSNVLEVRFLQENARFCLTGNSYPGDVTIFYFGELSNPEYSEVGNYAMEVIGNIYEHPELIKS